MSYETGVYILELFLQNQTPLQVGKLGEFLFDPGYYYYCGSAQGGLHRRLQRYLQKNRTLHWHIDYLLEYTLLHRIYTFAGEKNVECELAQLLAQELTVPASGFASSDCTCKTHLFYQRTRKFLVEQIGKDGKELSVPP